MKEIPLTQGQVALIDDKDYELVSQYSWYTVYNWHTLSFYARTTIRLESGKQYSLQMARLILGLEKGDKRQGDHINHDTLDNQRSNLHIVTYRQNMSNLERECTSKYPGVFWGNRDCIWNAAIRVNGKIVRLGRYIDELDAANVYQNELKKMELMEVLL